MREFTSSAKRASMVENDTPIEFMLNGETLVATTPGSGQIGYFLATQASGDAADVAKAMLELMAAILGPDQYPWFESGLKDGSIDLELVMEMIEYFIEEWSTTPTRPASVSSRRSAGTGKPSTAKRPSKA